MARLRILQTHSFYGLLLMHMKFAVDEALDTACTDGERIVFGTGFLDDLSDDELDFVLMHEILHVALQHCFRSQTYDPAWFNIACDIVVNSLILEEHDGDLAAITLGAYGEAMHLTPAGEEGCLFTAEEVYAMLPKGAVGEVGGSRQGDGQGADGHGAGAQSAGNQDGWRDDHSRWRDALGADESLADVWEQRVRNACEVVSIRNAARGVGSGSLLAERLLKHMRSRTVDWRIVLQEFVQPDIDDYSFMPPDRRFGDSPFFLPDLNAEGAGGTVENIWFVVDTSASVSDDELGAAYAEVCSAIDQFDGRLSGSISFMEGSVTPPVEFSSVDDVRAIKPVGGGGTSFAAIFAYLQQHLLDDPPVCIVVITDGHGTFPKQQAARGIPVFWLINNNEVDPPWGKVARMGS